MKTKYVLACGDFHCGHLVGLTPPKWNQRSLVNASTKRNKFFRIRESLWDNFKTIIKQLPELDAIIINGDMIDGKGKITGGTEQITTSLQEQCDIACDVIQHITFNRGKKGYKIVATFGTGYHTDSEGDQWEGVIANKMQFDKIGAHEWLDVNGLVFDIKHHVGSSGVPYARHTAIAKSGLWNSLWASEGMQPLADVILRSHVHYYTHCGTSKRLCMTLPALQGMGSRFGALKCEGTVDWGVVLFEITDKNDYNFYPFIHQIKTQKAKAFKI